MSIVLAGIFELITDLLFYLRKKGGRVSYIPFNFVIKSDLTQGTDEAKIIRFVRGATSIPVPHVFLTAHGFGRSYFLMNRIRGECLEGARGKFNDTQKQTVIRQLRGYMEELRALKSPHGRAVSGLNNAACKDARVSSQPFGPFSDEAMFNDHLISIASSWMDESTLPGIRSRMSDRHRIFFTHGDFAPQNIIVRGDKVVAILDWEYAGWYPEHWEYIKALYNPMLDKDPSWNAALREIIQPGYDLEWRLDKELSDCMVGAF